MSLFVNLIAKLDISGDVIHKLNYLLKFHILKKLLDNRTSIVIPEVPATVDENLPECKRRRSNLDNIYT